MHTTVYKYDTLVHCNTIVQPLLIPRTTNDPTRIQIHCLHWNSLILNLLLENCRNPLPFPPLQSWTCAKWCLLRGWPNYESVLRDMDILMGRDSENIPSERCEGEARRANPKRKARFITRSVAETFAYCTSKTASNEDAGDVLKTFRNVCWFAIFISSYLVMNFACNELCYLFVIYCETRIWSGQLSIGFSGSPAHRYAQCSSHSSVLWG